MDVQPYSTDDMFGGPPALPPLQPCDIKDEWGTPRGLFERVNSVFHFKLDACASIENAKVSLFWSRRENGLNLPWHRAGATWLNPPYSKPGPWLGKAWLHGQRGHTVVALVNADTSTRWFNHCWDAFAIIFLRGRIRFEHPRMVKTYPNPKASCLVVFGTDHDLRIRVNSLNDIGKVIIL